MIKKAMFFQNLLFFFTGLCFLLLAKMKHLLQGYVSPKTFSINQYDKCVHYDISVVDGWLKQLKQYTGQDNSFIGKNILELGPGSDLGIGLYLLYNGASQYNAIDINHLIKDVPDSFYEVLFRRLSTLNGRKDILFLRDQLQKTKQGSNEKLNYLCRNDFNIEASLKREEVDLIFSQAAFEHFDDMEETIRQLSTVAKSGAVLITEIDLKTHSRWIRDVDPNNIYRYSDRLYRLFHFRGSPNRLRPFQYKNLLEKQGWKNIQIIPESVITESDAGRMCAGLAASFTDQGNQMNYLSIILCATKF
jgi:hypothetical protein